MLSRIFNRPVPVPIVVVLVALVAEENAVETVDLPVDEPVLSEHVLTAVVGNGVACLETKLTFRFTTEQTLNILFIQTKDSETLRCRGTNSVSFLNVTRRTRSVWIPVWVHKV